MKIFSRFFLCNESESYLILIDKRPSNLFNSNSFIRYTFQGLLEEFFIGQLIYSTKNSFYQINEKVDLTLIQLDINEGYLFQLDYLSENYIHSLHCWKKGVIYEIIPASYQDSNNDGWGDSNGLKQRLDYIQQLCISFQNVFFFFDQLEKDRCAILRSIDSNDQNNVKKRESQSSTKEISLFLYFSYSLYQMKYQTN